MRNSFENLEASHYNEQIKLYCGECKRVYIYEEASSEKCSQCGNKLVYWENNENEDDVIKKWKEQNNKSESIQ